MPTRSKSEFSGLTEASSNKKKNKKKRRKSTATPKSTKSNGENGDASKATRLTSLRRVRSAPSTPAAAPALPRRSPREKRKEEDTKKKAKVAAGWEREELSEGSDPSPADDDGDPDYQFEEEEEDDEEEEEEDGEESVFELDSDDNGDARAADEDDDEEEDDNDDENYDVSFNSAKGSKGNKGKGKTPRKGRGRRKGKGKGNKGRGNDSDEDDDDDGGDGKKRKRKAVKVKKGEVGWYDEEGISLGESPLHLIRWSRIVLDEAHKIKARNNSTAKSVYALTSLYKWCVTGTPLQNRVGELYSLVRFLRMDKFSQYFCKKKDCDCVSYKWNFGPGLRHCITCGHPPMYHYSYFNKAVINPIKRYGYTGDGKKAMLTLKEQVLDRVMLRRTKKERAKDVKLPPLHIKVIKLELDEEERDFYDCIYQQSRSRFDTYVDRGTLLHNYAHIFDLLSRLRQAVDHPYLVIHGSRSTDTAKSDGRGNAPKAIPTRSRGLADVCGICREDIKPKECVGSACRHTFHRKCMHKYTQEKLKGDGFLTCPVCYDSLTVTIDFRKLKMRGGESASEKACILCLDKPMDALLLDCGHMYTCMACAKKLRQGKAGAKACPICRAPIKKIVQSAKGGKELSIGRTNLMNRVKVEEFASSTKVEALVTHIKDIRKDCNTNKAIVFSQYTGMLDIVEWRLNKLGLKTVKLAGSLSVKQRMSVLGAFKEDPSVAAILMSLKAGGEGLNLQEASHVFLLDPWWNPAVEMQAIQRAHRIGQTKEVRAIRFITTDTIEDRMLELQSKKELVFSGTIDAKATSLSQLTEEDLRFLFQN